MQKQPKSLYKFIIFYKLSSTIYNTKPLGIFAIINKNEDYLFENKIGSVGLPKFTHNIIRTF